MKKLFAMLLVVAMVLALGACANSGTTDTAPASESETAPASESETTPASESETTPASESETTPASESETTPASESETTPAEDETPAVMTYAEYDAAELQSPVTVETYIQAKQSWWDNKATFYTQDKDGAYFLYEMPCTEEEYNALVPGTKIRVSGYKSEWSGEIEITDATYEILPDDTYIAEARDVTDLLGTDDLIKAQNQFVSFKGMTVEAYDESGAAFAYKNDADKTDDLYFKVSKDGNTYSFCVEFYLTGQDSDVYKAVEGLKVGDVIDMEGFLYWYEGANPHITSVTPAA